MRFRILPLLFFVHFWMLGFGQTEKGSWLVDGEMEFNTFGDTPVFQLDIRPKAGYFFKDKLLAGAEIGFVYLQAKFANTVKYSNYFATPFIRYYFLKSKFHPYAQVDYSFDLFRSPELSFNSGSNDYHTEFTTAMSASIGGNYFLNQNIAINAQFIFTLHDNRREINQSQNDKFRGFRFGLNYFFDKNNNLQNDTLAPLVFRYLKKGNFSIGLQADITFINFKTGGTAGTIEWSIFLFDKLRLLNKFTPNTAWNSGIFDLFNYWGYQPEIQSFIPITSSTFLTATIGGDVGVVFNKVNQNTRIEAFGWSLLGKSSLVHFRRNSILEFGTEFRYFFRDRFMVESARWDGDLFLKFTQFLTAQWNVELEVRTNMFGLSKREVFNNQSIEAPEFLRLGFNYFIEKSRL